MNIPINGIIRNRIKSKTATWVLVARSCDELVFAVTHERPIRPKSKGVYACVITKAPSTMLDQKLLEEEYIILLIFDWDNIIPRMIATKGGDKSFLIWFNW